MFDSEQLLTLKSIDERLEKIETFLKVYLSNDINTSNLFLSPKNFASVEIIENNTKRGEENE